MEKKVKNKIGMRLIGRITQPIAKKIKHKAAYIYLSDYWLKHNQKHSKEIETVGMTVEQFIIWVVKNFNQIRTANDNSIMLVVANNAETSKIATIDVTIASDGNYEVKTAQPRRKESLRKNIILWEKKKRPKSRF